MKKLLIIGSVIVVLFAAIIVLTNVSNQSKLEIAKKLYGDKELKQETIDQVDDKNYQNIMLPDKLEEKIKAGEPVNAYFFSPICIHCQAFTPVLMPIAEELGVDIAQLNVYEYDDLTDKYNIEATPTFIRFEDGKEVNRFVGALKEEDLRTFLNTVK
ncbi:thioredoxin [Lysinibacillus sp. YS11]|uniref:Thioredoxin family protein n=1 Tax=Lysinibacillus capsici TaxID=2115968 RepID=A0ABY8KKE6_9BACI|nr:MULTISPECIES: thioredoxin family protein [Lysinibacillus]AUS87502.1 thioredoxin [Lysinibacillus sp. YS11]MDP1392315.1 thioredoxin family protein [Lysinibacillus capsici]MDP1412789.1 thioredoxin family protein [Lysinibacillus capsici]MDP1428578.1 thioredoxin family protein [Lysinibacillus capsici]MEC1303014.1 thioredoxin family protein [Lysinibacillus capsici]